MADCYRLEGAIWDDLLNENYKGLAADLDEEQKAKLRDMQRAWIVYRDSTCGFYYTKIQGTMAGPMGAACDRSARRPAEIFQRLVVRRPDWGTGLFVGFCAGPMTVPR